MDDILVKTGGGIILAALGGITFIAYNHPRAYGKLVRFLFGFLTLLYFSLLSWDASNNQAANAVYDAAGRIKSISTSEMVEIGNAVKAQNMSVWCFIAILAISFYLLFLWSFPRWLLDEKPPDGKNQKK